MKPQEILKSEGFRYIYEWHDEPHVEYPAHTHKGKVSLFIGNGDITFQFSDGLVHTVRKGQRFDVPVGVSHTAMVGEIGCDYVVGEMIEGDS